MANILQVKHNIQTTV